MKFLADMGISSSVSAKLLEVVEKESEELAHGAVVIVQDARCRLRRLPI
jgi:plasmid maintenance system antidote protein VapI